MRLAVLRLVVVLLRTTYCCLALSSLVTRKNEKRKKKKNVTKSKESKELREDSPTNNFFVGNYGLRRADERWEDTPSMSSEVGEI